MPRIDLTGASAIVTGGASGIGEATVRELARLGARVVIADLDAERAECVARDVDGIFVRTDVTSEDDATQAVAAAGEIGPLRVLVNSAGIGWPERTLDRNNQPHRLETFERVLRINLIGSFNMLRLAAVQIAATETFTDDGQRGAIVNLTSVAAFDGQIGQAAYAASKGGIVGMTLPIARDLAAAGIRVNTVAPGLVDTPIYDSMPNAEELKARLGATVLFPRRLALPDELAFTIVDLVTNPYMNGEVVRVDGGIRMAPK